MYNQNEFIIEGSLINDDKDRWLLQAYPGLNIEIEKKFCKSIEQATDPITGRTLVRIVANEDAEVKSVFQLKLFRLTSSQYHVPFSLGGVEAGSILEQTARNFSSFASRPETRVMTQSRILGTWVQDDDPPDQITDDGDVIILSW